MLVARGLFTDVITFCRTPKTAPFVERRIRPEMRMAHTETLAAAPLSKVSLVSLARFGNETRWDGSHALGCLWLDFRVVARVD